jgi:hypothetical protein
MPWPRLFIPEVLAVRPVMERLIDCIVRICRRLEKVATGEGECGCWLTCRQWVHRLSVSQSWETDIVCVRAGCVCVCDAWIITSGVYVTIRTYRRVITK